MLYRAFSLFTVKDMKVDEEFFTVKGIATTPTPDRVNDVVDPMGAKFAAEMPLLWQHQSAKPVGHATFGRATKNGIPFTAKIPLVKEAGVLKDRIDEAIQSIKYRLVAAVSIGFRVVNDALEFLDNGGIKFNETEIMELSLVTIPAQPEAVISDFKSMDPRVRAKFVKSLSDAQSLAASGHKASDVKKPAGVSAPKSSPKEGSMKTLAEQIAAFEAKRQASDARMNDLMAKAAEEDRTLLDDEQEEYDGLEKEVTSVDNHLVRLRKLQAAEIKKAVPITHEESDPVRGASQQRSGVVTVKDNLEKGIEFARYAICVARGQGNPSVALDIAKAQYPDQPRIQTLLKAAIAGGSTTHITWAGPLVQVDVGFVGDFVEYLRPRTILGKFGTNGIPSLRRVPFNVSVPGQTTGGTGYWVGEGAAKPVTKFDFNRTTVPFAKVANIAVLTEELVRFSSPSAERLVRDGLAEALIAKLDADFVDPTKTAVAGVSPASITQSATPVVASGYTVAALRKDTVTLIKNFIAANMYLANGVWIMSSELALNLANMTNALGQPEFPTMSMQGGSYNGMPVIVSDYVPKVNQGSPTIARPILILVDAQEVWLADDGNVTIDVSREAALQMDTAPTNTPTGLGASPNAPTAVSMVSLWQTNSVGIRAEREINWLKRRAAACQYLTNASYSA